MSAMNETKIPGNSLAKEGCAASICSVFEARDTTNDEPYYQHGIWLSLEDALRDIRSCEEPSDVGDGFEMHEDYARIEIYEISVGWPQGINRSVATIEWSENYDIESDEYIWEQKQNEKILP